MSSCKAFCVDPLMVSTQAHLLLGAKLQHVTALCQYVSRQADAGVGSPARRNSSVVIRAFGQLSLLNALELASQVYTLTYERGDGSDASEAHTEAATGEQPAANPVRTIKHGSGHAVVCPAGFLCREMLIARTMARCSAYLPCCNTCVSRFGIASIAIPSLGVPVLLPHHTNGSLSNTNSFNCFKSDPNAEFAHRRPRRPWMRSRT